MRAKCAQVCLAKSTPICDHAPRGNVNNSPTDSHYKHPRQITRAEFDIVAISASAGGIKAITEIVATLPAELSASLVFLLHLDPKQPSMIADILRRQTALQVKQAKAGDYLYPRTLHIAPPNHHLLVNPDGTLSLTQSEFVNFVRPSADLLFKSVAASYKQRALAVVLTGTGSDGIAGIKTIKKMGGTIIAQNGETADFSSMPNGAIQTGAVDFVLPLAEIAPKIVALVATPSTER